MTERCVPVQLTMSRLSVPSRTPLPEGLDAELREAGVFWDAVRVPGDSGERVLAVLDDDCGAVIRDACNRTAYFMVRPGAADAWRFPVEARVRVLGTGSYVVVPPPHCGRSAAVSWTRPVVNGRVLTRSRRLHAVLQNVVAGASAR
jgi:hypothetical protein